LTQEWNGLVFITTMQKKFLEAAYSYKNINVEGIYSHFATAEYDDLTFAKLQLERLMMFSSSTKTFNHSTIQTYL